MFILMSPASKNGFSWLHGLEKINQLLHFLCIQNNGLIGWSTLWSVPHTDPYWSTSHWNVNEAREYFKCFKLSNIILLKNCENCLFTREWQCYQSSNTKHHSHVWYIHKHTCMYPQGITYPYFLLFSSSPWVHPHMFCCTQFHKLNL